MRRFFGWLTAAELILQDFAEAADEAELRRLLQALDEAARTAAQLIVDGVARLADPGDVHRLQEAVDALDRRQAA